MEGIKPKAVGFFDDPVKSFIADVNLISNMEEYNSCIQAWAPWFSEQDHVTLKTMTPEQMPDLFRGRRMERKGISAMDQIPEKTYAILSVLLFPEYFMKIDMVAMRFKVPFGVALSRLRDVGIVKFQGDKIIWTDHPRSGRIVAKEVAKK